MQKIILAISCLLIGSLSMIGCAPAEDPYKNMSAQNIYKRAKKTAKKGNYPQAIKDFDALEAQYPYGEWTDKGQIAMIHSYYKNSDYASALAAADRFIRVHPRHPNIDYVYYLKGIINYDDNYGYAFKALPIDKALRDPSIAIASFDAFRVLLDKHPESKYAPDARKRMLHLRDLIARHELATARFYMGQGAYVAAANRASYLVNHFPRTAPVADALRVLSAAYIKLGMHGPANEALSLLKQLYPDSPEPEQIF